MELTTTITAQTRVSAGLEEDGRLSVKVFAGAEYAKGRTTTAEVSAEEIPEELRANVKTALQAVLAFATTADKDGRTKLGPKLVQAVTRSAEVAAAHGEI